MDDSDFDALLTGADEHLGEPRARRIGFGAPANPTEGFPRMVRIASRSSPDVTYDVELFDATGFGRCPCKGFQFNHRCSHLDEARAKLLG